MVEHAAHDGVHPMVPRERMPDHVRKLRDAYAITPDAPLTLLQMTTLLPVCQPGRSDIVMRQSTLLPKKRVEARLLCFVLLVTSLATAAFGAAPYQPPTIWGRDSLIAMSTLLDAIHCVTV